MNVSGAAHPAARFMYHALAFGAKKNQRAAAHSTPYREHKCKLVCAHQVTHPGDTQSDMIQASAVSGCLVQAVAVALTQISSSKVCLLFRRVCLTRIWLLEASVPGNPDFRVLLHSSVNMNSLS